jgi:alpha-tubulin suppressor-like RCC1 family protein
MSYVSAGSFSGSVSKESGSLYLWGTGSFGVFKTPHRVKKIEGRVLQVDIGESFGAVLTEDRKMYTWGQNYNG